MVKPHSMDLGNANREYCNGCCHILQFHPALIPAPSHFIGSEFFFSLLTPAVLFVSWSGTVASLACKQGDQTGCHWMLCLFLCATERGMPHKGADVLTTSHSEGLWWSWPPATFLGDWFVLREKGAILDHTQVGITRCQLKTCLLLCINTQGVSLTVVPVLIMSWWIELVACCLVHWKTMVLIVNSHSQMQCNIHLTICPQRPTQPTLYFCFPLSNPRHCAHCHRAPWLPGTSSPTSMSFPSCVLCKSQRRFSKTLLVFFHQGHLFYTLVFPKLFMALEEQNDTYPAPWKVPPIHFPWALASFFFLLILMVIMEFLCLVSMHNGVINYVAIGVSSTQCVQPICASQRGGGAQTKRYPLTQAPKNAPHMDHSWTCNLCWWLVRRSRFTNSSVQRMCAKGPLLKREIGFWDDLTQYHPSSSLVEM